MTDDIINQYKTWKINILIDYIKKLKEYKTAQML